MERGKRIATVLVFFVILWGFLLTFFLLPDASLSHSERRKLAQRPTPSVEGILTTDYMQELESYAQDQFPLREEFRAVKAGFGVQILGQRDSNGIYLANGSAVKIEATLKPDDILYGADKINEITAQYLQGMKVYCAIIPDKHFFAAEAFARPSLDYDALLQLFTERLDGVLYLDLRDSLSLEDYYRSDAHWRQEALGPVRDTIATALGCEDRLPAMEHYRQNVLYPFSGVYRGQSALPVVQDNLVYLSSEATDSAVVSSAEQKGQILSVYAPEKIAGTDGYDVFLNGAQAILQIENPLAQTDKELVIFRDSFGSSLAPLLVDAYCSITLIDLRYVSSKSLGDLMEFSDQDVLFLYSTNIVNSGRLLR